MLIHFVIITTLGSAFQIRSRYLSKNKCLFSTTTNGEAEDDLKLPHDDTYIVDTNLIIAYATNDKPFFKQWADKHMNLGHKLYFMEISRSEFKGETPFGFELLQWQDGCMVSNDKMERITDLIIDSVGVKPARVAKKLRNDIQLISLAGFIAGSSQIPSEAVASCSVVFATANFRFIRAVLKEQRKRDIIEKIIDDAGLEHLIPIVVINDDGSFEELL